jgi:hypothetical protein
MPQRLGRYAVRRRIGNGAFATVWLAYDEQLDSPVAVKVLADNWTEDAHVRKRFQEEGRYLRKVESPHVVSVYDAGELDDGRPYLVMSYADQGTLADRTALSPGVGGLSVAQAMEIIRQVGAGLQDLHDRDIVHRDVKPANVLFRSVTSKSGEVSVRAMVGDLGLGRALDMSSRLTMVAGTPAYVAPEQARAEAPDARADQYSLAALSYLLLSGRPAFQYASLAEAGRPATLAALSTPARPYPPEVDAVLRRGLAYDRDDRYPDVTSFVTALESALGSAIEGSAVTEAWLPVDPELTQPGPRPALTSGGDVPGSTAPTPPRRRGRAVLVGSVVGLVGLVGLGLGVAGGYALERSQAPDDRTVDDADGTLSVTVPAGWDRADAGQGWEPPNAPSETFPALSVGTAPGWTDEGSTGHGVFVALLPGDRIPEQLPQHPECDEAADPVRDTTGDVNTTVVMTGCPGGVTVERVVQVTSDTLLWIQVRSPDRATANRVLDSVETHGL